MPKAKKSVKILEHHHGSGKGGGSGSGKGGSGDSKSLVLPHITIFSRMLFQVWFRVACHVSIVSRPSDRSIGRPIGWSIGRNRSILLAHSFFCRFCRR
jgi:hypothetical protein